MSNANNRTIDVAAAGTFDIKDLGPVRRLGFGAMRITGPGIWGEPADREVARSVVRRAVELGVDFIDTADSYGPAISEEIIAEALHPYPAGLRIATKAGFVRTGPNRWHLLGRPDYLRQQVELSLRRLKVDVIDLFQLHRIDPTVDRDDQFGVLRSCRTRARCARWACRRSRSTRSRPPSGSFTVATVQNRYNLTDRSSADVLEYAQSEGIGFIPWAPVSAGELARPGGPVDTIARRLDATPAQVALAWVLQASPVMLPIPGTGSVDHLEENLGAATLVLPADAVAELDAAAQ